MTSKHISQDSIKVALHPNMPKDPSFENMMDFIKDLEFSDGQYIGPELHLEIEMPPPAQRMYEARPGRMPIKVMDFLHIPEEKTVPPCCVCPPTEEPKEEDKPVM